MTGAATFGARERASRRDRRNRGLLAFLLACCLFYSTLGCEWTWGVFTPWIINATARLLVLPAILLVAFALGIFDSMSHDRRTQVLYLSLWATFALAIVLEKLQPSIYEEQIRFEFYFGLVQAFAVGVIGYLFPRTADDVHWLVRKAATLSAIVGVAEFIAPEAHFNTGLAFPSLAIGFPVRLLVLLGYCWFLYCLIVSRGFGVTRLIGLTACSLGVYGKFEKNTVLPALICTAFLVFAMILTSKRRLALVTKFIAVCLVGFGVVASVDIATNHALVDSAKSTLYRKYFHAETEVLPDNSSDLADQASAGRFELWRRSAVRFYVSPWVGSGFGQAEVLEISGDPSPIPVHNGFLDLVLSVGILGTAPVFVGTMVWFATALRRRTLEISTGATIPIAAYVVAILAFNLGSTSRLFTTVTSVLMFFMGLTIRAAGGFGTSAAINGSPGDAEELQSSEVAPVKQTI